MPPEDKFDFRLKQADESVDVQCLLAKIEDERVPERLLALAQELQIALNTRKRQLSLDAQ
jgi:hypothetical protein